MAPWTAPVYLTRVCCIFELWSASRLEGCRVSIVMPPAEATGMNNAIMKGSGSVKKLQLALVSIAVEKAEATVEDDRKRILAMIENDVGFDELNRQVTSLILEWCLAEIKATVAKMKEDDVTSPSSPKSKAYDF